jgi:hypothetical protein
VSLPDSIGASPGGVLPPSSTSSALDIGIVCTECVEGCGVSVGPLRESMETNDCVAEEVSAYERLASIRDVVGPCVKGRKCSMGTV